MALSKELRKRIEAKLGREIKYSSDCDMLAMAIEVEVGERLGLTTLKRMFGFTIEDVTPRGATLDVLARFLGYADMADMERRLGEAADISAFAAVESVDVRSLGVGRRVRWEDRPDRILRRRHEGDGWFEVLESVNGKLLAGDRVRISVLALGFELLASDVERGGSRLGQYHSAKDGGLTSLELLD